MGDVKTEYEIASDDDNSVICVSISNSEADVTEEQDYEDDLSDSELEIMSLNSENPLVVFVKEETDDNCREKLTLEEITSEPEDTRENLPVTKFVDRETQTDDVIILPKGSNIEPTLNSTNGESNSSSPKTKNNVSWREIRPYRRNPNNRMRPYNQRGKNNYSNRNQYRDKPYNSRYTNNSGNNDIRNPWDSRPYNNSSNSVINERTFNNNMNPNDINPNWPVEVQNYYKDRVYNGFVHFVNYVFHDNN